MSREGKFYFVEHYSIFGRITYSKTRGEPIVKSADGSYRPRVIRKHEITETEFNQSDNWKELKERYFPIEPPITTDVTIKTEPAP